MLKLSSIPYMVNLYIWTMYYYTICIRNTSSVLEKIKITTWHWYLPWSCASTWLIPRLQVSERPVSEWTAKNLEMDCYQPTLTKNWHLFISEIHIPRNICHEVWEMFWIHGDRCMRTNSQHVKIFRQLVKNSH